MALNIRVRHKRMTRTELWLQQRFHFFTVTVETGRDGTCLSALSRHQNYIHHKSLIVKLMASESASNEGGHGSFWLRAMTVMCTPTLLSSYQRQPFICQEAWDPSL